MIARWSSYAARVSLRFTHGTVISESFYFFLFYAACLTFLLPRAPLYVFREYFFFIRVFLSDIQAQLFYSILFQPVCAASIRLFWYQLPSRLCSHRVFLLIYNAHDQCDLYRKNSSCMIKKYFAETLSVTYLKKWSNSTIIIRHSKSIVEIIWLKNFPTPPRAWIKLSGERWNFSSEIKKIMA